MAKTVRIQPRHDFLAIEVDQLEDRPSDHNRHATGQDDGRPLAFVALDTAGNQIGAIAGYTWAGMAEIKQLWVDEAHRGLGIGRQLLEAAGRPKVPSKVEDAIRKHLRAGNGILKVAAQRVKREMAGVQEAVA